MDKLKINSVRAVMKTLNVGLSDLVENDELIGLLCVRIVNGSLKKDEIFKLLNELSGKKPEVSPVPSGISKVNGNLHFATHGSTGVEYALDGKNVIGPVILGNGFRYVIALKNAAMNLKLEAAMKLADKQKKVDGINWIVPSDEHFMALQDKLLRVNRFLEIFNGDKIGKVPFLSTTSQANPPQTWNVRLILPLPQ